MTQNIIIKDLTDARDHLDSLICNFEMISKIDTAAELIAHALNTGGRVFSCGNGGSMCDAMHFAEELSGYFRDDRAALAATAISDPAHMSCVANDAGFEKVFSRYIEAHGRADDVLLAISTSGNSRNIINAINAANDIGMTVIVLTGAYNGLCVPISDVAIVTPAGSTSDRVQELHIKVIHILIELIERKLFPQNYSLDTQHSVV